MMYIQFIVLFMLSVIIGQQHFNVEAQECQSELEVIVVADGSVSVSNRNFEVLRNSVISLVNDLNVNQHGTRLGFIMYSTKVDTIINLSGNATHLIAMLQGLKHPHGQTNTAAGISSLSIMVSSVARSSVPVVGIVITDGQSNNKDRTRDAANNAKKIYKVNMFAVGVGNYISQDELITIASNKHQVLHVNRFPDLHDVLYNLAKGVCQTTTNAQIQLSTETTTAAPTQSSTVAPTQAPTVAPTKAPTVASTQAPTTAPTQVPTEATTQAPSTQATTAAPTQAPTTVPTAAPSEAPNTTSTRTPTSSQTQVPTIAATQAPTAPPTQAPTSAPTQATTKVPSQAPTTIPTRIPTASPTTAATPAPTLVPTEAPSAAPTASPTETPVIDPNCVGCKLANGIGYNNHKHDCSKFIQCASINGAIIGYEKDCPFGLFWDQDKLTCNFPESANCQIDPCKLFNINSYKKGGNCRQFMACEGKHSSGKCCSYGSVYDNHGNCLSDQTCQASCTGKVETKVCEQKAVYNDASVYDWVVGTAVYRMPCPIGTAFNSTECGCTQSSHQPNIHKCRPIVDISFDEAEPGEYDNYGAVLTSDGNAYFDGNSNIKILRLANVEFRSNLMVQVRYKYIDDTEEEQAIVTNGDCGETASIIITTTGSMTHFGVTTDSLARRDLFTPSVNEWRIAELKFGSNLFYGTVDGNTDKSSISGVIKKSKCAFQLGHGTGFKDFKGYIDYIVVSTC